MRVLALLLLQYELCHVPFVLVRTVLIRWLELLDAYHLFHLLLDGRHKRIELERFLLLADTTQEIG